MNDLSSAQKPNDSQPAAKAFPSLFNRLISHRTNPSEKPLHSENQHPEIKEAPEKILLTRLTNGGTPDRDKHHVDSLTREALEHELKYVATFPEKFGIEVPHKESPEPGAFKSSDEKEEQTNHSPLPTDITLDNRDKDQDHISNSLRIVDMEKALQVDVPIEKTIEQINREILDRRHKILYGGDNKEGIYQLALVKFGNDQKAIEYLKKFEYDFGWKTDDNEKIPEDLSPEDYQDLLKRCNNLLESLQQANDQQKLAQYQSGIVHFLEEQEHPVLKDRQQGQKRLSDVAENKRQADLDDRALYIRLKRRLDSFEGKTTDDSQPEAIEPLQSPDEQPIQAPTKDTSGKITAEQEYQQQLRQTEYDELLKLVDQCKQSGTEFTENHLKEAKSKAANAVNFNYTKWAQEQLDTNSDELQQIEKDPYFQQLVNDQLKNARGTGTTVDSVYQNALASYAQQKGIGKK